jgi:hypothetical protein
MRVKLIAAIYAITFSCFAISPWSRNMASYLGDASMAWEYQAQMTNEYLSVDVQLSPGTHDAITLTGWYSITYTNYEVLVCAHLFYTPDEVQRSNPDLLDGALAHSVAGGTNLTGTFSFPAFPYATYTNHPSITNTWKWGVYTIAGWSSNSLTINLGGIDYSVGPGAFNRNAIAGGSGDFIVTGTGLASIGVSKTPCHKFYETSILNLINSEADTRYISGTNGFAFWAIRIDADGTNHVSSFDVKQGSSTWISAAFTNACTKKFSSSGIYKLGFVGLKNSPNKREHLYDVRAYKWRLSDSELERVYNNGLDDKDRRGYQ